MKMPVPDKPEGTKLRMKISYAQRDASEYKLRPASIFAPRKSAISAGRCGADAGLSEASFGRSPAQNYLCPLFRCRSIKALIDMENWQVGGRHRQWEYSSRKGVFGSGSTADGKDVISSGSMAGGKGVIGSGITEGRKGIIGSGSTAGGKEQKFRRVRGYRHANKPSFWWPAAPLLCGTAGRNDHQKQRGW